MVSKRIDIENLAVGMYVVGLDKSWLLSPFLFHRRYIKHRDEITLLKQYGIRQVTIDPTRGHDVAQPESATPKTVEVSPDMRQPSDDIGQESASRCEAEVPQTDVPGTSALDVSQAVFVEAMVTVQGIFEGVKTGGRIDNEATRKVVRSLLDNILHRRDALMNLIRTRQFDWDRYTHAISVCVFSLIVGQYHGFDSQQLECLGIGALLHDVGEMRLPRNLLHKSGVYTLQERRLMQEHPRLGVAILSQSADTPQEALRIVAEHHEHCDGSGYPARLRRPDIGPLSQIVGIAEVYEGMLSCRRGRPGLLPEQAIKRLYQCGLQGQFDLSWVELTIRCLGIYPVGSLVELNTGEVGIVTAVNPVNALRPTVTIILDSTRRPYPMARVLQFLESEPHEPQRAILRALDPVEEKLDITAYLQKPMESTS
jgi:HD-GYP domain-containing protein (c-di-GMP phosphodiesterase class II)